MSNLLTGDFDAILQIDTEMINAALAALHEQPREAINLPHVHANWLDLDPAGVHGFVQVQFGAPRIRVGDPSVPARLTFNLPMRSRFSALEGTTPLPEFLAGDIIATFELRFRIDRLLGATLDVVTTDPLTISNHPAAAPLSGPDRARAEGSINEYARRNIGPVTERLRLPAAVTDVQFGAARDGGRSAVCLLAALGAGPAARRLPSPIRCLTGAAQGFAIAVSREYLVARLDEAFGAIPRSISFTVSIFPVELAIDRVDVQLVPRVPSVPASRDVVIFNLTGHGTLHAIVPFPFSFTVAQAFEIRVEGGSVVLAASGDPVIGVHDLAQFTWIPGVQDGLRTEVAAQRDTLVRRANDELERALADLQPQLLFDRAGLPGRARLTEVVIDADGLILRGTGEVGASAPPVAALSAATDLARPDEVELNALASWVPGGSIDQYRWSSPSRTELVHFIHRTRPDSPEGFLLVWLTISGRQVSGPSTSRIVRATRSHILFCAPLVGQAFARAALQRNPLESFLIAPGQYLEIPHPFGQATLAGHIDVCRIARTGYNPANLLVYVEGDDPKPTRAFIRQWLNQRPEAAPAALVVVVGAKDRDRTWWDTARASQTCIVFADDRVSGWTRNLGVAAGPSFFLISRDGDLLWEQRGRIDGGDFAHKIESLVTGSPVLTWSAIGPAVAEGDLPPDFVFETAPGYSAALRKLRGSPVALCFCKPWSAACLETVEVLATIKGELKPIVVAISDGEPPDALVDFVKSRRLDVTVVGDRDGRIGTLYGVWCWPTTVTIAANGRIAGIDVGMLSPASVLAEAEAERPQPA